MKLYDVPYNTRIRVLADIATPIASLDVEEDDVLMFHHIDGMYSFCTDKNHNPVHLVAWAEVEIIEL